MERLDLGKRVTKVTSIFLEIFNTYFFKKESKIYKKSPGKSRLPSNFFLLLLKINKDIILQICLVSFVIIRNKLSKKRDFLYI